jgi:predicted GTPase
MVDRGARQVIILGAAGRDFHNFNVAYRTDRSSRVLAFTAAQIPNIDGRVYPSRLAGELYPDGIPIIAEDSLEDFAAGRRIDEAVFSYSDVSHEQVMHLASRVLALGADFRLLGPSATMLSSTKPVVAVCAVRTGSGKSQTTAKVCELLAAMRKKAVIVRHPMPYGDLVRQEAQRFATIDDLDREECTIEEREEYERHLRLGTTVFAGVDYEKVLRLAEAEADVIVWDGGNNDLPFFRPDLHIVVADPHRAGHESRYHPGETNVRMADAVVINKVDGASRERVEAVRSAVALMNPRARIVEAESVIETEGAEPLAGRAVLVVEDGPTVTHGEMRHGAGFLAAERAGARIVDPRPHAVGALRQVFDKYPHLGPVLPAMGYGREMIADLEETIRRAPVEVIVEGTPVDLSRLLRSPKPVVRVRYSLRERGGAELEALLRGTLGGPALRTTAQSGSEEIL